MSVAIDIFECMFEYGEMSSASAIASSGGTVRELQDRIHQMQATKLDTRRVPTHPSLAGLLPGGFLKQGASYSVEGSLTLLMALVAGPSAAGAWCAIVGVPEFGIEAAASFGIDLDRLALVPHPGEHWLTVAAALADVLSVVVARPSKHTSAAAAARLAARIRQRGTTLIVLGSWPQSEAVLSLSESRWSGIGNGHGYLSARQVTVTAATRAGARSRRLWLPDREQQFRAVEEEQHQIFREAAG
jgi:hypothetical protein